MDNGRFRRSGYPISIPTAELRSTRKLLLVLRLDGVFLIRYAERQFCAGLFQLPPRITRREPADLVRVPPTRDSVVPRFEDKKAAWSVRLGHPTRLPAPNGLGLNFADRDNAPSCRKMICSVWILRAVATPPAEFRASRNPLSFVRFVGVFALRFAARQFAASLSQLPPRFTRFEPLWTIHHVIF